ncbi:MAG: oxidoreductase [Patescibacteria group bacterium]
METEKIINPPPNLIVFSGHTEEWDAYQESLFQVFCKTIVEARLTFQGMPVNPRRFPEEKGKHFTFWHLISEGEKEEDRTPDLRRCERLDWVAWVIQNCESNPDISYWESRRKRSKNFVIWYEKGEFAVVIARRSRYFVLLSAYHVMSGHRINAFIREREEYRKSLKKS